MSKLLLLFITLILGLVYLITPNSDKDFDFFFFSDVRLYLDTYLYFVFEKLTTIILIWIIAAESRDFRKPLQIFFWLAVADFVDFLLTYNSIWFTAWRFPISMNIVKVVIFGLVIINEWNKSTGSRYFGRQEY